ncbi:MAG: acyl-CoA dehydrogenase family protein, partial [Candidatus Moranbacteria bacterium]|nr:acyl-CoA dehydrogenase family protein [Candidatus Moranbacteria bacterium]
MEGKFMDLDLSDEQIMLRDSLRKMLADQSSVQVVRKMEDDPVGTPASLWKYLAEMGVMGLTLPEEYGGSGLGAVDLAVVFEELGRALCPAPVLETSVISGGIIALAGSDAQKKEWLPRIAAGEVVLTPAFLEPEGSFKATGIQLKAEKGADGYRLNGQKFFVGYAASADRLVTLVRTGAGNGGIDILLVDPKAKGVTLTKTASHAQDPRYQVTFDNVVVPLADRIGAEGSGWATWCAVGFDMMVALSAWFVGCGNQGMELGTTYAKERVQFDRPIGSFQAIAHQLADSATGL